jgi:hypothetical protein
LLVNVGREGRRSFANEGLGGGKVAPATSGLSVVSTRVFTLTTARLNGEGSGGAGEVTLLGSGALLEASSFGEELANLPRQSINSIPTMAEGVTNTTIRRNAKVPRLTIVGHGWELELVVVTNINLNDARHASEALDLEAKVSKEVTVA